MPHHSHDHSHGHSHDHAHDAEHFDAFAEEYDASPLRNFLLFAPTHQAVIDAVVHSGQRPGVVLDIGCGTGRLLERAARTWPYAQLIGIDASSGMVEHARKTLGTGARFRFDVGNAASLPLESASVDVACTSLSFHHWEDQAAGMREAARVLRPGGLLVLADLQPPRVLRPVMRRFHAPTPRAPMIRAAGLDVTREFRPLRLGGTMLVTVARKPS